MVPHVFGWFTMTSVWFILVVQLENAKRDISEVSDRRMPEWVDAVIYGSFLIFMSFAFVQIVFQRLAPGFYWGTEVAYCILSLTAKMYLGWFLLINVIYVDGSTADETLSVLCADPMFTSVELRQELLIRLCVPVRPPTPAILSFWKKHLAPDQPYKHVASDCVADNGTKEGKAANDNEPDREQR